jgi:hypothetical protein
MNKLKINNEGQLVEEIITSTAVYYNRATKETYRLGGIADLESAWNMASFVCSRNNWNLGMFHIDVKVSIEK